jgi:RNA polymerase sigma-70 factor (ECF subfamily)
MTAITRNVASKCKERMSAVKMVPIEEAEMVSQQTEQQDVRGVPLSEVVGMIDQLPEGYGQVFRLSVFEGMSHKEIADMLGIEPHSSSSQLARAKKMLRKMMQQYWAAVLLLLLVPITFYLFRKGGTAVRDDKPVVAKQKDTPKDSPKDSRTERPQEPVIVQRPAHRSTMITIDSLPSEIAQTTDSTTVDTLSNMIVQKPAITDTTQNDSAKTILEAETPRYDIADLFPEKQVIDSRRQQKWSVDMAYVGGTGERNGNRPYGFTEIPTIATTGVPSPVTFENWSDYAAFLAEEPDDGSSHKRSIIKSIALNNANDAHGADADKIVRKSRHQMPVGISLALQYRLNRRFALETGLSYSRLKSEFEMGSNGNTINELQTIHYLGIPVKGIYNIYNRKTWSLYSSLGVTTEFPLRSPLITSYYLHGKLEATDKTTIHTPWQWSLGTGLGLQYHLTPSIGLFAEPSLQYYIPTGTVVETYRTEHPFSFSLPLGIRFTW